MGEVLGQAASCGLLDDFVPEGKAGVEAEDALGIVRPRARDGPRPFGVAGVVAASSLGGKVLAEELLEQWFQVVRRHGLLCVSPVGDVRIAELGEADQLPV